MYSVHEKTLNEISTKTQIKLFADDMKISIKSSELKLKTTIFKSLYQRLLNFNLKHN